MDKLTVVKTNKKSKFFNINLQFTQTHYFFIAVIIGVLVSSYIPEQNRELKKDCPENNDSYDYNEFEPHLNLELKPKIAKKIVKNIIRPRYYSSELGIREKLFVGIMTSQENIETVATSFNKTAGHLVNKIKFFINADNVKKNFLLKNIVGFTDTRENLRPFHILKYIGDNYLDDFDFFLLLLDSTYLDARKLKDKLYHISSFDIYMGNKMSSEEKNYCDLSGGIILSSSVIRKIRNNLDWCVRNAVTNYHSLNIGKCVKYSSKIDQCQESFQDIHIDSYNLNNLKIYRDLHFLKNDQHFREATTVYPISSSDDFYLLHAFYSRLQLETIKTKINNIDKESQQISNGTTISNNVLEVKWPLGVPPNNIPETRHDILTWTYLNLTHSFMWDSAFNVKPLPIIEAKDMSIILNRTLNQVVSKFPYLIYQRIHSAYRKFDPVRGMDYRLHLLFLNKNTNKKIIKNFEIVKPLGLIEIVSSPYVTESTRIAILLPTFEHQLEQSMEFLRRYEITSMKNQDNTFLMLVLLYREETPSKVENEIFQPLKIFAGELSNKYKSDGSRIAWVSIRLPAEFSGSIQDSDNVLSSVYARNEILSLAMTDLALRKIGLDSLILTASNSMTFRSDFLNRVRMNCIQGFQIFSPIGFMNYPCKFSGFCKECDSCDVGQGYGYFDRGNYDVVAFYSRDYVEARKKLEASVPIVRSDNDIRSLLFRSSQDINSIVDMFTKAQISIHILRAIEPNLRFGESLSNYLSKLNNVPQCLAEDSIKCIRFASKKQIDGIVLNYEEHLFN